MATKSMILWLFNTNPKEPAMYRLERAFVQVSGTFNGFENDAIMSKCLIKPGCGQPYCP